MTVFVFNTLQVYLNVYWSDQTQQTEQTGEFDEEASTDPVRLQICGFGDKENGQSGRHCQTH